MLDVAIVGGEVVDGTGSARRRADVGIVDGNVVTIGRVEGEAADTIDATGKVVTPGFVDVHTHYDAQVFWDGALTPSPLHGVTTALGGNCGFTISPLSEDRADAEYLMRMLARVEGMPIESLREGVPWDWTSTGEYFERMENRLGINAGFMVGHSALRRVVMGPDAVVRPATEDELARMQDLLRASFESGAIGFSSSWTRNHNDAEGNMVPSRHATHEEVVALAAIAGEYEGTSLEFIPQVPTAGFDRFAIDLMSDMSAAAQRPLNWNVLGVGAASLDSAYSRLAASDEARSRGGRVVALTIPMGFPVRLSFRSGFILDAMPEWESVMFLPLDEKREFFRDPARLAWLNERAQQPDNPMRGMANWGGMVIHDVFASENEAYRGRLVGEIAEEEGRDPWDVLTGIALADDLNTSFGTVARPESDDDWKARVEIWRDPRAVIGGSDAGAHLDVLASFHYTTVVLGEAVRERGLLGLEEAVHLLTDVPARLYGLRDRGRLEEGAHADVVVLDPATVASDPIRMRMDLPGGAARLYAGARGIGHVLVNGRAIVRDGELTDERSGTLLRSGRDIATPSMS
jgi:N-acyl-D-aspartate/D-glutamate deacylase